MMEGLGFILLGILAMMLLCGFFKIGGVIGSWLDLKKVELENKRKNIEER
ncbi:hypothetical protein GCM10008908_09290 [Clostridium subterminale]|uniref:DUF3784 domain-containing protein n=1 Tax=Clostridium subterminale TaxID=1550 RepID=A0ABP3VXV6_CLOSU